MKLLNKINERKKVCGKEIIEYVKNQYKKSKKKAKAVKIRLKKKLHSVQPQC